MFSSQCRTVIDVMFSDPRKLQGDLWTCGLALGRGFTSSKYDPQVMPLLAQKCNDCGPADVGTRIRQHCSGLEPVLRHAQRSGKGCEGHPILRRPKPAAMFGSTQASVPSTRRTKNPYWAPFGGVIQEAHLESAEHQAQRCDGRAGVGTNK